ncbi:MAG: VanW family protein [Abditibacteriota bacterium]|nr:VanW family protein [Abditibacteriota bacterium]
MTESVKNKKLPLWGKIAIAAAAAVLLVFAALGISVSSFDKSGRICKNVTVGGNDIGGMKRDDAEKILRAWARSRMNEAVTLTALDTKWSGALADFGVDIKWRKTLENAYAMGRTGSFGDKVKRIFSGENKLEVVTAVDKGKVFPILNKAAREVNSDSKDAGIKIVDGSITITQEELGKSLNKEKSIEAIEKGIKEGKNLIPLVINTDKPKVMAKDLKDITTRLSTYTTRYNPGKVARTHNVMLAAKAVNGKVLMPGDTFSYNGTVGPRDAAHGYKDAPIFVSGNIEPGMGGGICQVSTTLYNTALLADMKIVERYPHQRVVDYAPAGLDATVAYGSRDFRFTNNRKHPVAIVTRMGGGSITVEIYGAYADKRAVKVFTGPKSYGKSGGRKVINDPTLPAGKEVVETRGTRGCYVTSYKVVDGGSQQVVAHNTYPALDTVVRVGTKVEPKPEPKTEAKASPKPASKPAAEPESAEESE